MQNLKCSPVSPFSKQWYPPLGSMLPFFHKDRIYWSLTLKLILWKLNLLFLDGKKKVTFPIWKKKKVKFKKTSCSILKDNEQKFQIFVSYSSFKTKHNHIVSNFMLMYHVTTWRCLLALFQFRNSTDGQ